MTPEAVAATGMVATFAPAPGPSAVLTAAALVPSGSVASVAGAAGAARAVRVWALLDAAAVLVAWVVVAVELSHIWGVVAVQRTEPSGVFAVRLPAASAPTVTPSVVVAKCRFVTAGLAAAACVLRTRTVVTPPALVAVTRRSVSGATDG